MKKISTIELIGKIEDIVQILVEIKEGSRVCLTCNALQKQNKTNLNPWIKVQQFPGKSSHGYLSNPLTLKFLY